MTIIAAAIFGGGADGNLQLRVRRRGEVQTGDGDQHVAFLPSIIKALIATGVVVMGAAEGFTFQNQVASNSGGLVDPNSTHFLYSVATSIDAFTIWTLILTGIGYSCVTRVKRGTCMAVVSAGGSW